MPAEADFICKVFGCPPLSLPADILSPIFQTNSTAKPALLAPDPLILDEYEQGGPYDLLNPPAAPNSLILNEYQPQAARIPPHEQDADLGRDPIETMHGHEPDSGEFRAFQ